MAIFSRTHRLDVDGDLLGAFAGRTFVASFREGGRTLVAKWTAPQADPELVTPVDPQILAIAASPDGSRVALSGVESAEAPAEREPVALLVATLEPPSGVRLVAPSAGFVFGEDLASPRLLWSRDGRHLALGGLWNAAMDHVFTLVFDLDASPAHRSVVFGRPVAWQDDHLLVSVGDARSAWDAARDAEVPWDGTQRFTSPDGNAAIEVDADGATTILAGEERRPLVNAPAVITWAGPHHLAREGRALDVLTRREEPLVPRGEGARIVALARDGADAVIEAGGVYVWASR